MDLPFLHGIRPSIIEASKHIFVMHLLELMRLIYVASVLMMLVMVSAQCQQKSEDWLNKGNALSMQNKYNEAIKCYDEVIKLDPMNAVALNNKVNALNALGRTTEANATIAKAKNLSETIERLIRKGNEHYDQGKYDKAIKAYDEAIKLDSDFEVAWENKGNALYAQGKYDEAIKAYGKTGIKSHITRNHHYPNLAMAWEKKGDSLKDQGKYDEAIKAYYEAVQLDSSNSTLKAKVNALREQNESDEIKSETLPLNEDKIPSQIPSLEQGKVTVMFDVSKAQEEAIKKKWEHDNPVVFVTSKASAYDHISNYSLDLGNMYLVLDLTIRNQGYDNVEIDTKDFSIIINNTQYDLERESWYNLTSIGRQYLLDENNAYLGLGSGTHKEGSIVFQVPLEKDIKYELKWTPPGASNITTSYE
jgi:tetratricopeptide (TPR) repeat protein